ncbi:hypothetical protein CI109_104274 [Kwoniella shandongensis]|uniref:Uncharacterized protein n=1 Tax=Kwoniella shandongensis TaxID=1734106 RepID=A0A5M6C4C5_9TREE|nr:uncharacterized protein CI109_002820 [Kwoniella shandongensis]KAA5528662.1 hypothetical protein CI109_002820 [Kwoniella shandongensis]
MVTAAYFVTILSLLPFSLSHSVQLPAPNPALAVQPAHVRPLLSPPFARDSNSDQREGLRRKATKGRRARAPRKRSVQSRIPLVDVGGVELDLVQRGSETGLQRRGTGNGTVLSLGTSLNTFVVPITIGSPPTTYPLQLDLASSDLLLASTLCTSSTCPASLGTSTNPYYDVSRKSNGLVEVNANQTRWNSSYADATVASGFVIREVVTLGETVVEGQVMGLINSTNLTLSEQKISGILGLGFPRLSALSHFLLPETATPTSNTTTTSAGASSTPSPSTSATSPYLPPLLENLVRTPHLPYPVFGLALAPPPNNSSSTSTATSSSASPSSSSRYHMRTGSLTLGGVSSLYVSNDTNSGRTINDIEWHDVVPFGRALSNGNDSTGVVASTATASNAGVSDSASASSQPSASASANGDGDGGSRKKRSDPSNLDALPTSIDELGGEEYLFWTLNLGNVTMNGTNVGIRSSYADIGLGSVALLDAGFTGLAGPQQDVVKLFGLVPDARQVKEGQWAVPCNTKMTMGFSFGGRYVQLLPSDWMYAQVASSSFCLAWPIAQASAGDGIDWQLGTPFLKNVYSVFSYGINGEQAPLVGFLPLENRSPVTPGNNTSTNATTTAGPNSPTPTTIAPLSLTTTIQTVLPNAVLANPTYATPSYVYSATPTLLREGVLQYEGLANSTEYSVGEVPILSAEMSATTSVPGQVGGSGSVSGGGGDSQGGGSSSGAGLRVSGVAAAAGAVVGGVVVVLALL